MAQIAKIKVKRAELIKVVEGRLRKLEADHKRAVEAYPDKLARWNEEVAELLIKTAARAQEGKLKPQSRNHVVLPDPPIMPDGYRERCQLERTLKTLKIGSEDSILLSPDDADHYFGPCQTRR